MSSMRLTTWNLIVGRAALRQVSRKGAVLEIQAGLAARPSSQAGFHGTP